MSLPAHAYLCRLTPIFQGKRSGYRNRKAPFRSELCVVPEHVISRTRASLLPRGADADAFFITVRKTEHTPGVAVHDPDEIGQAALDLSRNFPELKLCRGRLGDDLVSKGGGLSLQGG